MLHQLNPQERKGLRKNRQKKLQEEMRFEEVDHKLL